MFVTVGLDPKFLEYIHRRVVSPNIPDDLLKELKEINDDVKSYTGEDYFKFPR